MAFEAVKDSDLQNILSSARQRGVYGAELKELPEGEGMWEVSLTEGTFAGKKAQAVVSGFRTAISKLEGSNLRVIAKGEGSEARVYIHRPA